MSGKGGVYIWSGVGTTGGDAHKQPDKTNLGIPIGTLGYNKDGIANSDEYRWNGVAWELKSAGSAQHVINAFSAEGGEFRTAFCGAGAGLAAVPNTDLSTVPAAADLIVWTSFISSVAQTLTLTCGVDQIAGNNHLGWWVTIDGGTSTIAIDRLREALGTAAGKQVARYAAGATVNADENKASFIVMPNTTFQVSQLTTIADVYCMPIAQASTTVGTSLLSAVLT